MEQQTPQTPPVVTQPPADDAADIQKNKTMAMLAYLIFFLPLLTDAKDSPFAKYHANQGLLLLITAIVLNIITYILGFIPILGWIVQVVVSLAILALFIMGLINANNGKKEPLPVIGTLATIIK